MRLSEKERTAIIRGVEESIQDIPYKLYLFGSRLHDKKKGGDIDLLLVCNEEHFENILENKSRIKFSIFNYLPEQRLDLTVATPQKISQDPFLQSIFPEAKRLSARI